jgi:hypothetical protein
MVTAVLKEATNMALHCGAAEKGGGGADEGGANGICLLQLTVSPEFPPS